MILDVHTHHIAPQPQAIVCADAATFSPLSGQFYSLGVHPWDIPDMREDAMETLAASVTHPQVLAIGEAGIDTVHPAAAPLFRQVQIFTAQVRLAEEIGKPLIIHDVKAHDVILGLHKDLTPSQPWIIHGFRGKPTVARMLRRPGIHFSFGKDFNPDTLREMPPELILAETDDSDLDISAVIERLSAAAGKDLTPLVAANAERVFCRSGR